MQTIFEAKQVCMLMCLFATLVAGITALADDAALAQAESSRSSSSPTAANVAAPPTASRNAADRPAPMKSARARRAIAIVTNGVTTTQIVSGPGGLEISANAPGTITVASGSNAVTLNGDVVTISGAVALAPGARPGVTVSANEQGGYTLVREPHTLTLADAGAETDAADADQTIADAQARKDLAEIIVKRAADFDR